MDRWMATTSVAADKVGTYDYDDVSNLDNRVRLDLNRH